MAAVKPPDSFQRHLMEDTNSNKDGNQKNLSNFNNSKKLKDPSGTGVSPVHAFTVQRRCLPHWQQPGSVYFVTWRCRQGQALAPTEREIVLKSLLHWDNNKWTVHAAVIMPDHVHALVQPMASSNDSFYSLPEIIHSVKSYSAHAINKFRTTKGSLWQDERFDRIVRDEAEFLEKYQYLLNNPVKEGIVASPEDYTWLYVKNEE
jgi:REP element-mobilizing transposase RayT